MLTNNEPTIASEQRRPWNWGKFIGPKPPLQPRHVWAIRTRLQLADRTRDLALFNLAIDSKLRGCDVVRSSTTTGALMPRMAARRRSAYIEKSCRPPARAYARTSTRQPLSRNERNMKPDQQARTVA